MLKSRRRSWPARIGTFCARKCRCWNTIRRRWSSDRCLCCWSAGSWKWWRRCMRMSRQGRGALTCVHRHFSRAFRHLLTNLTGGDLTLANNKVTIFSIRKRDWSFQHCISESWWLYGCTYHRALRPNLYGSSVKASLQWTAISSTRWIFLFYRCRFSLTGISFQLGGNPILQS